MPTATNATTDKTATCVVYWHVLPNLEPTSSRLLDQTTFKMGLETRLERAAWAQLFLGLLSQVGTTSAPSYNIILGM